MLARLPGTCDETANESMSDALLQELLAARERRATCSLATVAATTGSVPREAGAKMIVYGDGKISGTIGGGKFEALVVAASGKHG